MPEKDEKTYEWSRKLASVAVLGADKYQDLNRVSGIDGNHNKAIDTILTEGQRFSPSSFIERAAGILASLAGADKFIHKVSINTIANAEVGDPSLTPVLDVIYTLPKYLADGIDNRLKNTDSSLSESVIADLKSVSEALKGDNEMLKAKVVIEIYRHMMTKDVQVEPETRTKFIENILASKIPELNHISPESISLKLLEDLQNYGLAEYVDFSSFLESTGREAAYGKAYSGYISQNRGEPKTSDVSPVPYSQRGTNWRMERTSYNPRKNVAVSILSEFSAHHNSTGKGYDISWIRENADGISKQVLSVLNNDVTKHILEFTKNPKVDSYERSGLGYMAPNFESVAKAIKVFINFGVRNNTKEGDRALELALVAFKNMTMELYDLNEV